MTLHRLRGIAAIGIVAVTLLTGCSPLDAAPTPPSPSVTAGAQDAARSEAAQRTLSDLEEKYDATLGVYALDTKSGRDIAFRQDDRFAYASTSKALLAGAVLAQATDAELDATVSYTADDLVSYSPVLEAHVSDGLPLREVVAAAVRKSDNTAANLLFRELGGAPAFEERLRALGDDTTDVARTEPALNEAVPGDIRDTSTPRALAHALRSYTLGNALSPERRALLMDDMTGNATGDPLIRAGVPAEWTVADKSGAAAYGTRNDIAIVQIPKREPIVMVIMSRRSEPDAAYDNALVADAARALAAAFA